MDSQKETRQGENKADSGMGIANGKQGNDASLQPDLAIANKPLTFLDPDVAQAYHIAQRLAADMSEEQARQQLTAKRSRGRPKKAASALAQDSQRPTTPLDKACWAIASPVEGTRNNELNRQAFSIAQRLAGGTLDVSEEQARQQLAAAAQKAGLSEAEITGTLDSAFKAGTKEPIQSYDMAGGQVEYSSKGVWFIPAGRENKPAAPVKLASHLTVAARTLDDNNERGFLLQGKNDDGDAIELTLSARLVAGSEINLAQELAARGFIYEQGRKQIELLAGHIRLCHTDRVIHTRKLLGWHGDSYLLPNKAITPEGSTKELRFNNESDIEPAHGTAGTLADWQENIASKAAGNTRFMFALMTSLTAPLLQLAGRDRGGYACHLRGASSTGKTTALHIAASLWGKPARFCIQSRATANAFEGLAQSRNDCLLAMDEIGQMDANQLKHLPYMFEAGNGKERSHRSGNTKKVKSWRGMLLSTGELSLEDILTAAGERLNAGQELRFLDIAMNALECLNGFADSKALAKHLSAACAKYYGAAGEEYLRRIVADRDRLIAAIPDEIKRYAGLIAPEGASDQAQRVADIFAPIAFAGELATQYGITGWQRGNALKAAQACFNAWLEGFGTGNKEEARALEAIRAYFVRYGDSRFPDWKVREAQRTHNATGFSRYIPDPYDKQYLVAAPECKSELCKGHDWNKALKAARALGWLINDSSQNIRTGADGKQGKYYVFSSRAMGLHVPERDRYTEVPANEALPAVATKPAIARAQVAAQPAMQLAAYRAAPAPVLLADALPAHSDSEAAELELLRKSREAQQLRDAQEAEAAMTDGGYS